MFTVFECRKCEHRLFVKEDNCLTLKLQKVAGKSCPACGEQEEGLWCLLGRAEEFNGKIHALWEDKDE